MALEKCPWARHVFPMRISDEPEDLSGRLIVAMPGMGDPRFERSVIFICVHGPEGSMGLIVNKPAPDVSFERLLEQLGIDARGGECPIHLGGPMEGARGFVLHAPPREGPGTLEVPPLYGMTTTPDILRAIASGTGPERALLALGYAGWGPGQLEEELRRNDWLVCDAAPELVFSDDNGGKWRGAMHSLGIDPVSLSATGGRA